MNEHTEFERLTIELIEKQLDIMKIMAHICNENEELLLSLMEKYIC